MAEEKCKKCGTPLEKKEDQCSCKEPACYHYCKCSSDCNCGCQQKEE